MKGLTFFKLISPYKEDRTKNCGLLGTEIDDNFFNLKENDIKDAYLEDDTLVLERVNGDIIRVTGITEGCAKDLSITYNQDEGALVVTNNGVTTLVSGFTTPEQISTQIYSDNTLEGKGTVNSPLSISPIMETGQYKPANKLIDTTKNEKLPDPRSLAVGDRYVTIENISDFGYLYDYNGVSKISADLRDSCSPWRVPTKEDWDNMLNAVEPRVEDRNHDKVNSNKYLGRFAGKLLKSVNFWKLESNTPDCGTVCDPCCTGMTNLGSYSKDITYDVGCEEQDPYCEPVCGTIHNHCFPCKPDPYPNRGVDKYGFAAVPAGYGDDGNQIAYFGERGWYWTATNSQCLNAYTKRFEYDKSTVFQEIIGVNNLLSLRLVKDYDGDNYNERESILGSEYSTVLMPSKDGKAIWTATNIAFANRYYNPVAPNNGIGLTYTRKFFINEWNGKRWLKNELKDGESIVFKKAPNGENDIEYRAINGELINVSELVYDNVIETIKPELDNVKGLIAAETVRAKEAERNLQVSIDSEVARAVQAENKITSQLEEEIQNRIDGDTKNASDIENLNTKLVNAITTITEKVTEGFTTLANSITKESEERKNSDAALDEKITNEIARATQAETDLGSRIDTIEQTSSANLELVKGLIKNEENRAIEAELKLDDKINKVNDDLIFESERAMDAESDLEEKIDSEISRSVAKDNELESKINDIDGKVSANTGKISEIETKLDSEIQRSTEQDQLITEKLLSTTGHSFSAVDGKLILNTINPDNKITIDLDFDFGTF